MCIYARIATQRHRNMEIKCVFTAQRHSVDILCFCERICALLEDLCVVRGFTVFLVCSLDLHSVHICKRLLFGLVFYKRHNVRIATQRHSEIRIILTMAKAKPRPGEDVHHIWIPKDGEFILSFFLYFRYMQSICIERCCIEIQRHSVPHSDIATYCKVDRIFPQKVNSNFSQLEESMSILQIVSQVHTHTGTLATLEGGRGAKEVLFLKRVAHLYHRGDYILAYTYKTPTLHAQTGRGYTPFPSPRIGGVLCLTGNRDTGFQVLVQLRYQLSVSQSISQFYLRYRLSVLAQISVLLQFSVTQSVSQFQLRYQLSVSHCQFQLRYQLSVSHFQSLSFSLVVSHSVSFDLVVSHSLSFSLDIS